ncbi:hypothetical protein A2892_04865 [Candidatus Woesebacteria bacterium RIFCSPLOWO2_01_FULL_39_10b]|uniref:DUF4446 domain-containing protein n=1 Tax=Candidatus Woesebacteria bacterium RIFCSPLOWO2_01_FULL_39_10b TaxID=1802517 RepID=A0A1F8B6W9_9BACT|nr:MAG: hypothetical protein A2892_04865 [Candidatus Woesebacteria bacterium RIFCSPLOWO2_01_FULL_39_10b]
MQIIYILAIVLGIWLLGLSIVLYKLFKTFNRLTDGVKEDLAKKGFTEVDKRLGFLEEDGKGHVQKIGLVKFNPFKELGGDHSFSLAILDGTDSGVVITGLHTRDRTRIYIKEIKKGKADLELSNEEKKALTQAQK